MFFEMGKTVEIFKKAGEAITAMTHAFDSAKDLKERVTRHIPTENEKLEGQRHPVTDVEYRKKTIRVGTELIEGVFPVFQSKFDTKLPKNLWEASDNEQFAYCTKQLAERIKKNPELEKQFTARQLKQIMDGNPRISGLTWHHNEEAGKMQLVDAQIHAKSGHTGGRQIWGGGSQNR